MRLLPSWLIAALKKLPPEQALEEERSRMLEFVRDREGFGCKRDAVKNLVNVIFDVKQELLKRK